MLTYSRLCFLKKQRTLNNNLFSEYFVTLKIILAALLVWHFFATMFFPFFFFLPEIPFFKIFRYSGLLFKLRCEDLPSEGSVVIISGVRKQRPHFHCTTYRIQKYQTTLIKPTDKPYTTMNNLEIISQLRIRR